MKRPAVQKVCELLGCVSWHVQPFSSVVTQGTESYWMRTHQKRCVSVCVCVCMHRYAKHRSSNSGPLNPLVKDCPNLPMFPTEESCHHTVHLVFDMSWSCGINRSQCPVRLSPFSLIAVCRFGAQAKRKSQKWCPAASAPERHVEKAADGTILLAALGAKMSIQIPGIPTYSPHVVVFEGHGLFVLKQFFLIRVLQFWYWCSW